MSNQQTIYEIRKVLDIFVRSKGAIRPHFILTGASGSGKSHTVQTLADDIKLPIVDVNAAQLTKEGTAGNSLSKALVPIENYINSLMICFVDEFDKLFITGNKNSDLAHETTNGVQNEFLRVLEAKTTSVFGDYGKYKDLRCNNILFIFAGAFNGEPDIDLDRLREFGIKTEFLGRVGLTYGLEKITLDDLENILRNQHLLHNYLKLFPEMVEKNVVDTIMNSVKQNYENNTIGVRILSTLTHRYFINDGKLDCKQVRESTFQDTFSREQLQ